MSFPRALLEEVKLTTPGEIRLFESRQKYHKEQLLATKTYKAATSAINYCFFSPYDAAGEITVTTHHPQDSQTLFVCGGARIQIYNLEDYSLEAEITDFVETVQCCRIRQDGKLLISADAGGTVRIIKADNRQTLRKYKAHNGVVRRADFLRSRFQAISAGDDAVLNIYDIAEEAPVRAIRGIHTDAVRACSASPTDDNMLLTAALDGTLKVWDLRQSDSKAVVQTYKHQSGVEAAEFFREASVIASASGNSVYFWDLRMSCEDPPALATGRCHHLGGISDLKISTDDQYTLTASSDKTVKLVSVGDISKAMGTDDIAYEVKRSILAEKRVSSCAMSTDMQHFVIGTETGDVTIWKVHDPRAALRKKRERDAQAPITDGASFFKRGRKAKISEDHVVVELEKQEPGARFPPTIHRQLQTHQYQKSIRKAVDLDSAEAFGVLLRELSARGALEIALRGHTEDEVAAFLKYMNRQIRKLAEASIYSEHLTALRTFIELNRNWLATNCSEEIWALLSDTQERLKEELLRAGPLVEVGQLAAELLNMEVLS